jgi:excinuclease ABC subunit C
MQDEAHRFAIEYHRQLRGKTQVKSVLDDIPGIGPTRRKALMKYFGDISKIREANVEELVKVDTMNERSAQAVYQYFH